MVTEDPVCKPTPEIVTALEIVFCFISKSHINK
jgi:hypothetical protein